MPQSAPRMLPLTLSDERLFDAGIASPLVTLLVTNYNYARYLRQCLDSVARQSYPYWECLIVDDVSSDDSLEVIEDFLRDCKTAHKFRLLRRERNGGQMEAFRSGLAQASGTFVVLLDADDVLLEDFLAKHLKVHLGKKPVAFTSSNQYQINGQGEVVAAEHLDHQSRGHYRYVPAFTFQKGYWIWATASSMMYRKAVLDLIFPGPETTFRICADYYIAHFAQMIGNSRSGVKWVT